MTAPRVASPARRAVLAEVASRIPELGRPVLVTVDGVDGSGKTMFADELADVVEATGRFSAVVRASVDGFHHPREHRHARGRTGETFWSRSFDYPALLRELIRPRFAIPMHYGANPLGKGTPEELQKALAEVTPEVIVNAIDELLLVQRGQLCVAAARGFADQAAVMRLCFDVEQGASARVLP